MWHPRAHKQIWTVDDLSLYKRFIPFFSLFLSIPHYVISDANILPPQNITLKYWEILVLGLLPHHRANMYAVEEIELLMLCTSVLAYSSDSNRQPVALISNITLIPPSTRSKNDTITSIYTSTFSQKYTITLIDNSMQFWSTFGCKFDINESASTA